MALGDYQIQLIHPTTGDSLDLIDARRIQALTYSRTVNDVGRFSLTIRAGDPAAQYKTLLNCIFDIYRKNTYNGEFEREDSYFLRGFQILEDGNQDYIILTGDHVLALFRDRLIIPDDDPNGANGYSTKSDIADLVMYEFVDNQVINPATNATRAEPVTNAPSQNLGQSVFQRKNQQNTLLETLQEATVIGLVDFTLTRGTGATFIFTVGYVGRNLTFTANFPSAPYILYDPLFRNIKNPSFTQDNTNEANVVYVGTQGIEDDRVFNEVFVPNAFIPFNRRETTTDAREIDDTGVLNAIQTAGYQILRDKQPVIEFKFDIETDVSRYNVDWVLGDRVTARYLDYQKDVRIETVEISISASGETITPKFQEEIL